jgi:hypothetical protein
MTSFASMMSDDYDEGEVVRVDASQADESLKVRATLGPPLHIHA